MEKTTLYCISFELHYYCSFLSRGRERFLPSARFLYRSFLQYPEYLDHPIFRLALHTMIPAGFLTSTAYSCLEWPSLRMVQYHSTPLTPRSCETTVVLLVISYPILFIPPAVSPLPPLHSQAYVTPSWNLLCYCACTPCTCRTSTSPLSR